MNTQGEKIPKDGSIRLLARKRLNISSKLRNSRYALKQIISLTHSGQLRLQLWNVMHCALLAGNEPEMSRSFPQGGAGRDEAGNVSCETRSHQFIFAERL